jgi:hypothetical protein
MNAEQLEWIRVQVYAKYPKLDKERACLTEKRFREAARQCYREKLIRDLQAKEGILESADPQATGG